MKRDLYDELIGYAEAFTTPEPAVLARLYRETHLTQVYPQMLSGHLQGTLLRMLCLMLRPARVLEIGTFTGYSAIAMGLGMIQADYFVNPDGPYLHTIEVNPELEEGIKKHIREAGLEKRIILHIGEALDIIPSLNERWDLVFIDADKPNYLNYYRMVLPLVIPGGYIVADNVLWDGKVMDERGTMDKDTRGIVEFNEFVRNDSTVENVLLPLRDGIMVIRKL